MRSTQELRVYHSLISQVIKENPDDPRIDTPRQSLRIIEEELVRRNNMPDFEKMDMDDLERYREKITKQREDLKIEFVAAGKILDAKRQYDQLIEDHDKLEAKRLVLQEKLGTLPKPPRTVNLKTLILNAKAKIGG